MNSELPPCPFCPPEKSDPRLIRSGMLHYVKCCSCGCSSGLSCFSEEQAIANWSRRAVSACSMVHLDRVKGVVHLWQCSECGGLTMTPFYNAPAFCRVCGAKRKEADDGE